MIGMLVTSTKYRIDKIPAPVHLKRLKAFLLFVSRLYPMPAFRVIIVQHHRVYAKLNNRWLCHPQAPDEQTLHQMAEQIDANKRKSLEKSLYRVGRGHFLHVRLNGSGISVIFIIITIIPERCPEVENFFQLKSLNLGICIWFWRTKEKTEVDLLLEEDGRLFPVEIKLTMRPQKKMLKGIDAIRRRIPEIGQGCIICLAEQRYPLTHDIEVVPVGEL